MTRPLLVVTLEGLATSAISCYGSSWNQTPAIDAIGGSGCVWDRWIATHDDAQEQWRAWESSIAAGERQPMGGALLTLITDDSRLLGPQTDKLFDDSIVLEPGEKEPGDMVAEPCREIDRTRFGQLIAAAVERDARGSWDVLWLHSRFLAECWDAPRELFPGAEQAEVSEPLDESAEEVDNALPAGPHDGEAPPAIFATVTPPQLRLPADAHPDLITAWMRTYGCQVRLIDFLLEVLLESLSVDDPRVVLAGSSGMSMGQNGWIGPGCGPLRSCDLRLPMIVSDFGPIRSPQVTPADLFGNVIERLIGDESPLISATDWCRGQQEYSPAVATGSRRASRVITTPHWQYIQDSAGDHLFLKPDDVEDANDVGRLRPDVIERLSH